MRINYPTTIGDVIDKLAILFIKRENIEKNDDRIKYLNEEIEIIIRALENQKIVFSEVESWKDLLEANRKLWQYEYETRKNPEIPRHKIGIYWNDLRHIIKNNINKMFGSTKEVKLHENLSCNTMDD